MKSEQTLILENIKKRNDVSYGGIIAAVRLTSSATFLTILLGMATNKIIAMISGTGGIAMIGLFRNLINMVVSTLTMGMTTIVVQRISTAASADILDEVIKSAFLFFLLQICTIAALSIFSAEVISAWMFGWKASSHILEIRIVLLMATGALTMQVMIALLNGKVNLKPITVINLVASFSTFLMVYPLLKMGNIGLAFVVGSGSFVGSCLGIFYIRRIYGLGICNLTIPRKIFKLLSALPVSVYLMIHPIIMTSTFLIIQVIINRKYGINELGYYNAMTSIVNTSIMLLMSSLGSYYLPTLGRIDNQREKEEFVNKVITMLLILVLPAIVCLILGAKYVLLVLYSKEFIPAANLVALQSMAMLINVYTWCYAFYLNHRAHYGTYLMLDALWFLLLLCGTWYFAMHNFPLVAVVINYLAGCSVLLGSYLFVIRRRYGKGMLNKRNIKLGLEALFLVVLSYIISQKSNLPVEIAYFCFIIGYTFFLMKKYYLREGFTEIR